MEISWTHNGNIMDILWLYYGDLMDIIWKHHEHIVVILWRYHGHIMEISWTYCGYIMEISWTYYGNRMDILWLHESLVALGAASHDRFQVSRSTCPFLPNWTRRHLTQGSTERSDFSRHRMAQQLACLI